MESLSTLKTVTIITNSLHKVNDRQTRTTQTYKGNSARNELPDVLLFNPIVLN